MSRRPRLSRDDEDDDELFADHRDFVTRQRGRRQKFMESTWAEGLIHFFGGAFGGTAGTAITCPLEVVKTRLQSSHGHEIRRQIHLERLQLQQQQQWPSSSTSSAASSSSGFRQYRLPQLRHSVIFRSFQSVWNEGRLRALYRGLIPNLIGVTPSKAVYFACYSQMKRGLNGLDPSGNLSTWIPPNSHSVHMLSAFVAAFVTATAINPIWVVKTRMQLNSGLPFGFLHCGRRILSKEGPLAFWKGVTGSYIGIFETVFQFVLYELFRDMIQDPQVTFIGKEDGQNFWQFMVAGGTAKLLAGSVFYPHEVLRTRLREEGASMRLRHIVRHIWRQEGLQGFWRGLPVQLLRSVPNTAITMGAYELVVYLLHSAMYGEEQPQKKPEKVEIVKKTESTADNSGEKQRQRRFSRD